MESKEYLEAIIKYTQDRFSISSDNDWTKMALEISNSKLFDKAAIRLKRSSNTAYWRIFLISSLENKDDYKFALSWAASVRDELLDPGTADLYLVVAISDSKLSLEQCINMEADEKICRKYILRPNETVDNLLSRTCLAKIDNTDKVEGISDPLLVALNDTAIKFPWLNEYNKEKWRKAFLSGKTGEELIDLLFTESNQKGNKNEPLP